MLEAETREGNINVGGATATTKGYQPFFRKGRDLLNPRIFFAVISKASPALSWTPFA